MLAPLLIEIRTEELPPLALNALSESLANNVYKALQDEGFCAEASVQNYATPRRLALIIDAVKSTTDATKETRRGPSLKAAYDAQGAPTKAAQGFAQSVGMSVDALETVTTDKGEWLVARVENPGQNLADRLSDIIDGAVRVLPIPKRMRWGEGEFEFARPVKSVIALLGDSIVDSTILGMPSGRITLGHRVLSSGEISIANANEYVETLKTQGCVFVDIAQRRQLIEDGVLKLAQSVGGKPYNADQGWDNTLLELVCALVEYPEPIIGSIDAEHMELAPELLITSMKDHQKYFPVYAANGELLPHFITVANIALSDPARVVEGNQRVLRARLADAEFFWKVDSEKTLESRIPELDRIMYHVKIGSIGDRIKRFAQALPWLVERLDIDDRAAKSAQRASALMKADLVTEVVGEFPELQGMVGRYYAERDGEKDDVALAIEEHYMPRHANDGLPVSEAGALLAVAERIDGLVCLYGAGEKPSGTKDRYALRRLALTLIRLLIDRKWALGFEEMIDAWPNPNPVKGEARDGLIEFLRERLRHVVVNEIGHRRDAFDAVIAIEGDVAVSIANRVRDLSAFLSENEATAAALAAGYKRAHNFVDKLDSDADLGSANRDALTEEAELALDNALGSIRPAIDTAIENEDYRAALTKAAALQPYIDKFFDEVLVLVDDEALRFARLALLNQTLAALGAVADFGAVQTS